MNQSDLYSANMPVLNIPDSNCLIIMKPKTYSHGTEPNVLNVRAIQFEPTLEIDPNNPADLNTRINNGRGQIFGFQNRLGRLVNDTNDENYSRLIIEQNLAGQVVLDNPWPGDQMSANFKKPTAPTQPFECRH